MKNPNLLLQLGMKLRFVRIFLRRRAYERELKSAGKKAKGKLLVCLFSRHRLPLVCCIYNDSVLSIEEDDV